MAGGPREPGPGLRLASMVGGGGAEGLVSCGVDSTGSPRLPMVGSKGLLRTV